MTTTDTDSITGLMAFWADIDADYVLRYQQWHNCEHIPERVSIPGFLEGRRYRSISDAPHFLMFYDTRASTTLSSDAYIAALNAPTAWTREALTHFRNPVRGIYSRIAVAGTPGRFAAPYIISLRFDLPEGGEDIYAKGWVQAAYEADSVERVRFYRADSAVANIATSERKIYGGGPGKQAYLILIEQSAPPNSVGDPINRADVALGVHIRRTNEEHGMYWLEIAHRTVA
jgi:hypothetical protein